ncbi:uncharacterized protein MONBRDRAFT_31772 [Monosiga brevicollis MX1]|uniref:LEM domain-containing protein n=1 Tax=Monosiga brevicollis TaxID=81824 RepID=A9UUK5_MONBE|nr:uncharacterized protein MONBRDRAFT_31772 [Monosiga brevicollis MX1]EDQ91113.1 predicted protein [Monosiga brevicollis MX1]|eukprot:XP_001744410.1 hypothetical protein [Monosiga brevicollis MX1]
MATFWHDASLFSSSRIKEELDKFNVKYNASHMKADLVDLYNTQVKPLQNNQEALKAVLGNGTPKARRGRPTKAAAAAAAAPKTNFVSDMSNADLRSALLALGEDIPTAGAARKHAENRYVALLEQANQLDESQDAAAPAALPKRATRSSRRNTTSAFKSKNSPSPAPAAAPANEALFSEDDMDTDVYEVETTVVTRKVQRRRNAQQTASDEAIESEVVAVPATPVEADESHSSTTILSQAFCLLAFLVLIAVIFAALTDGYGENFVKSIDNARSTKYLIGFHESEN